MGNRNKRRNQLLLMFFDIIMMIISFILVFVIRKRVGELVHLYDFEVILTLIIQLIFFLIVFYVFELYNFEKIIKPTTNFTLCFFAFITLGVSLAVVFFLCQFNIRIDILALQLLILFIFSFLFRYIVLLFSLKFFGKINYIELSGKPWGRSNVDPINSNFVNFMGYLSCYSDNQKNDTNIADKIQKIVKLKNIEIIVIPSEPDFNEAVEKRLVELKIKNQINIMQYDVFYEAVMEKIPLEEINNFWFLLGRFSSFEASIYNRKIKRLVDIVGAISGIIILFPIAILTGILIKLTSNGPLLYKQIRVGKNEKEFVILKFRSMAVNAEKNGATWAVVNDERITRFGCFIRRTRLDEIPQLWNILKGEMSFVGPRPERPEFTRRLKESIPFYALRHYVNPGLSGWAQVRYQYGDSIETSKEKLQYDLFYIKNQSPLLDFKIMLKTIRVVFLGLGAR